jgi:hypothetical protein
VTRATLRINIFDDELAMFKTHRLKVDLEIIAKLRQALDETESAIRAADAEAEK